MTQDPLFVDAAAGDYRLQRTSPAIDAGYPGSGPPPVPDTDKDGLLRPAGPGQDIGAHEWWPYSTLTGQSGAGLPGTSVVYAHPFTNTDTVVDTYAVQLLSDHGWASCGLGSPSPCSNFSLSPGDGLTIYVTVTIPTGVLSGTVDATHVTLSSQASPDFGHTVTDATTVWRPDLSASAKTVSAPFAQAGALPTYTIVLSNSRAT